MATIDDKTLVRQLLNNNGHYDDDPQAFSIWSYRNAFEDRKTQAVFYTAWSDMFDSPYVGDPALLWSRSTGLTRAGKLWLQENK